MRVYMAIELSEELEGARKALDDYNRWVFNSNFVINNSDDRLVERIPAGVTSSVLEILDSEDIKKELRAYYFQELKKIQEIKDVESIQLADTLLRGISLLSRASFPKDKDQGNEEKKELLDEWSRVDNLLSDAYTTFGVKKRVENNEYPSAIQDLERRKLDGSGVAATSSDVDPVLSITNSEEGVGIASENKGVDSLSLMGGLDKLLEKKQKQNGEDSIDEPLHNTASSAPSVSENAEPVGGVFPDVNSDLNTKIAAQIGILTGEIEKMHDGDSKKPKGAPQFFLWPHEKFELTTKRTKVKVLNAIGAAIKDAEDGKTFADAWKAQCATNKITASDLQRALRSMKTSRTKNILSVVENKFGVGVLKAGVWQAPSSKLGK